MNKQGWLVSKLVISLITCWIGAVYSPCQQIVWDIPADKIKVETILLMVRSRRNTCHLFLDDLTKGTNELTNASAAQIEPVQGPQMVEGQWTCYCLIPWKIK